MSKDFKGFWESFCDSRFRRVMLILALILQHSFTSIIINVIIFVGAIIAADIMFDLYSYVNYRSIHFPAISSLIITMIVGIKIIFFFNLSEVIAFLVVVVFVFFIVGYFFKSQK